MNQLCFSYYLDHLQSAFIILDFNTKNTIFFNKQAHATYHLTLEAPFPAEDLFPSSRNHIDDCFADLQKNKGNSLYFNHIKIVTTDQLTLLCDMRVGFFNQEKSLVFIEITESKDVRLETLQQLVDESSRPEAILEVDDDLSILCCNHHFHSLFGVPNSSCFAKLTNKMSSLFPKEQRSDLVKTLLAQLERETCCTKEMEIRTLSGDSKWISMVLQKRVIDPSEQGKIFVFLTDIKDKVATRDVFDDINQYFTIFQSMCKGLLYRFDMKTRTLYRNEETAHLYNVPTKTEQFPQKEWLAQRIHPDDLTLFSQYVDRMVSGFACEYTARLKNITGAFEYHKFTFKPLYHSDGTVKEMVGIAMNVHHLMETEKELETVSKYFSILQKLTKGMLYRLDIEHKILYRNEETAHFYGVPAVEKNFPDPEHFKGVVHPEDEADYLAFMKDVLRGEEGSHLVRLYSPSGSFDYHKITFRAIHNADGAINEMIGNAVNVQDLKETEAQLSTVSQYFDILQSFSNDLLYRLDIKTKTLYRNESTSTYYGIPPVVENYPNPADLEGVFHPDDIQDYVTFIERVLQGEEGTHTARHQSTSGHFEYHKFTFKKLENQLGNIQEMIGHAVNVQAFMDLETKASYDMLTKCLNKISFEEQVVHIINCSPLTARHALFFIDLDDFKGVNDTLGHSFGDFLLQTVGMRLKSLVREHDLVGRVGGDEFVLFLASCGDDVHLQRRGEQILETLQEELNQNGVVTTIKGSVGVSVYPKHGTNYEELYERADKALYHSKHLGKNVVTIYQNSLG